MTDLTDDEKYVLVLAMVHMIAFDPRTLLILSRVSEKLGLDKALERAQRSQKDFQLREKMGRDQP